jgi:benzoate-CoA ligase
MGDEHGVRSFNASRYLVERRVAEGDGERTAIRIHGRSVKYGELQELVLGAAAGLRELGVRPEERVVLVLLDGLEFVATFLGAMWIGAVPLPLNPLLPGRDLALSTADSRARVAVMSGDRLATAADLAAGAPELTHLVVARDHDMPEPIAVQVHQYAPLMTTPQEVAAYETCEDSPGFWLCTSGTTGRPKLAMHRHVDLLLVAEGYAREVLEIERDDRCLSVAPLFHAYGLGNSLAFSLSVGATAILEPTRPPTPALVAELAQAERPTLFFAVPTFYAALLAAELPEDTFASVRVAVSAGEALPARLFTRFADRFGVEILDGIGSTEMTHIFISNRRGKAQPGSSGTPVAGYRIRLVDDDGHEVQAGVPGQLRVSGASAATGYWCRAAATRQSFEGEWFRSGDMYVRNQDGSYTYLGRADDMLKVGGEWVAPAEVEAVLIEHPGVLEAVVVGAPRKDGLVQPIAYVVPKPDCALDEAELAQHCHRRLAGFKRPRRLVVVDALPKTATGKIKRNAVREWAQDALGALA